MAYNQATKGKSMAGKFVGDIRGNQRTTQYDKYVYETFNNKPTTGTKAAYHTPATGTDGDENILLTDRNYFEYHMIGSQTLLEPVIIAATGLDIGLDQANDEGMELTSGGIVARGRNIFTIGTDAAFFLSVTFSIAVVAGTDDCAVGFHLVEPYQATVDGYNDMAILNVISGDIKIETIVGGAGATTTDTTNNWTDAQSKTLTVEVSGAGVVTYKIDGSTPTTIAAYTFTDAIVVTPFMYLINASGSQAGVVGITAWECGYQGAAN